jgi:SAM-dependent methyltransferase
MPDSSELKSSVAQVTAHWNAKATEATNDCARVDAGLRAQRMRFEAFVLHHDLRGKSILDVGCGVGDFWAHLRGRGIECDYLGVDLAEAMIARSRERFPEAKFETRDILAWDTDLRWDYVVSFAIHNVKFPGVRELLEKVTARQFELCRAGAHVDLLTDRYSSFDPQIQPWRAEEVLALSLAITPYVVLRHDFLPHDFCVTLYRQPLIDTHPDLRLGP